MIWCLELCGPWNFHRPPQHAPHPLVVFHLNLCIAQYMPSPKFFEFLALAQKVVRSLHGAFLKFCIFLWEAALLRPGVVANSGFKW